ncbi:uncharacterized protein Z520_03751 [Fonsecaea multimorphosa CBS 102226]|uniref:ABM domain-containing protein n=1 Tax=Fonsecaea multimorphosa CBS 102226 TaxID=1442371 RepID=A0A0D2HDU5_9EURO|nr:uncharacterized protein Z520_03751 [Fonsecaea multimorphosa CBS 102226]KIY00066.1 hypothetical protein Z520_03751 [Fonsecaea multimorphosa CBS 102226]OAL27265.1 hypothetical protein AYO22_03540 [Fonsecaea multimorphosa]
MPEVHIIAIFTPRLGKVERVKELLIAQCREVHEKEDYALRFLVTEQIDVDVPELALFETYTSMDDTDRHLKEPHFLTMSKILAEEDLLSKKTYVARTVTTAGFDLDREFRSQ